MKLSGLLLCLLTGFASAAERLATLDDGTQVWLADDFTWRFVEAPKAANAAATIATTEQGLTVVAEPQAQAQAQAQTQTTATATAASSAVAAETVATESAPVAATKPLLTGWPIQTGSTEPLHLQEGDVEVWLSNPTRDGDNLVFDTRVKNSGRQPVILIDVAVTVMGPSGEKLYSKPRIGAWRSIKRMAETYLREGQEKAGLQLSLPVKAMDSYRIEAEISEVKKR
ncbi:DUF3157 family protein [Aliagarivorans marinus]|uniref:DUF3157 family protein n=1 Tax=Aliagarivorans marinus TaxID=561965 RepID=UPI0004023D63|nr:DUF3157 family protein [Aliagarivorans marinus]